MATSPPNTTAAPPKISDAPTGNPKFDYKSLTDALNKQEEQWVKEGRFNKANVYEIVFAQGIGAAKVANKGPSDKSRTATQGGSVAAINSESNSVATGSKNISAPAGTQIVQFIEQVVRDSSYITDRVIASVDQTNPGGPLIPNTPISTEAMNWFKILVDATPIDNTVDIKRNNYAYKLTYIVTPFAINELVSDFFPPAKFRGVHKVYNYWFTGLNTQVLGYEQSYNSLYTTTAGPSNLADGIALLQSKNTKTANRIGNAPNPTLLEGEPVKDAIPSAETTKGAPNSANTPAAIAADFLYSAADQKKVDIKIVGDPAWLLQGEMLGVDANTLNYSETGFYPDGTVCTETQQIVFAVNFNSPADYNNGKSGTSSGTGLVDINSAATDGNSNNLSKAPTQASAAYYATDVISTFSRGKFEQTLTGAILKNLNQLQISKFVARTPAANTTARTPAANTTGSRTPSVSSTDKTGIVAPLEGVKYGSVDPTSSNSPNSATPVIQRGTQPADPDRPTTSGGVVVGTRTETNSNTSIAVFSQNDPNGYEEYRGYVNEQTRKLIAEGVSPQWVARTKAEAMASTKFDAQLRAAGAKTGTTTSTPITNNNRQESAPRDQ